jgi:hypothetical protein
MVAFLHESASLEPRFKSMPCLPDDETDRFYQSLTKKTEVNAMSEALTKGNIFHHTILLICE